MHVERAEGLPDGLDGRGLVLVDHGGDLGRVIDDGSLDGAHVRGEVRCRGCLLLELVPHHRVVARQDVADLLEELGPGERVDLRLQARFLDVREDGGHDGVLHGVLGREEREAVIAEELVDQLSGAPRLREARFGQHRGRDEAHAQRPEAPVGLPVEPPHVVLGQGAVHPAARGERLLACLPGGLQLRTRLGDVLRRRLR
ncbi:hypothetical protein [Sorangium sp. So ce861]|uniref:hypothetical protein n=1 Tax=Sorangium sp. So ce861 TaxID=3133323 RepID=UPI003F63A0F0